MEASHPSSLSHGKTHVFRVVKTCKTIARAMNDHGAREIDMEVLLAAAYFHDLGRLERIAGLPDVDPPRDMPHAKRSVAFAIALLQQSGDFPVAKIGAVERAIVSHSFSGGLTPPNVEARILSDADKLDAMGATGILRTIAFSVERGRSLEDTVAHLTGKIVVLGKHLVTGPAKALAERKEDVVKRFLQDLLGSNDRHANG